MLPRRMQPTAAAAAFSSFQTLFRGASKQEVNDQPMGNGPYKFAEWKKGRS